MERGDRRRGEHHHESEHVEHEPMAHERGRRTTGGRAGGRRRRTGRSPSPSDGAARRPLVAWPASRRPFVARRRRLGSLLPCRPPAAADETRTGGRSRRPARRSPLYQSKLAQAGDSSTTSPAAARSAAAHGLVHRCRDTRAPSGEHLTDVAAPRRWPRRRAGAPGSAIGAQVETLVLPTGDEHDVVEGADRGQRGVGRRRLRVVVPAHAPSSATSWMRWWGPHERGERRATASGSARPVSSTSGSRGECVGEVVGQRRSQATGATRRRRRRAVERAVVDVVVGAGARERAVHRGRGRRQCRATVGSAAKPMATSSGPAAPEPRLGARYVAIERCQSWWSGARFSHTPAFGPEPSSSWPGGSSCTRRRTRRRRGRARLTSGVSVLPASTARHPAGRAASPWPSAWSSSCRRSRSRRASGAVHRGGPAPTPTPGRSRCARDTGRAAPRTEDVSRVPPGSARPARRRPARRAGHPAAVIPGRAPTRRCGRRRTRSDGRRRRPSSRGRPAHAVASPAMAMP